MNRALKFEGFSYRYPGATEPALRDIDLEINAGEFVVLAGASGSGKSSLLRAACGLAPGFDGGTAAGKVTVGQLDTREHKAAEIARFCGTVLQDPERQTVMSKVRAEVALPLESRGFSEAATARAVEETALLVGIGDLLDRSLSTLSGGELQRVATAAALASRPPLLLLDEPTSQLDPVAADDLAWLLRRLNEEQGIAIVIAEQRLERLLPAADRVVVLEGGKVVCDGDPQGFLIWASNNEPSLQTPGGALFSAAGIPAQPVSVKQARQLLIDQGIEPTAASSGSLISGQIKRKRFGRLTGRRSSGVIEVESLWDEPANGRPIIAGLDLSVAGGETVALMGRNGAGKSTLLRHIVGISKPTSGRVKLTSGAAMLTQNPGDHLIAETVGDLADASTLAAAGIRCSADRHPRDLSGGERQRLAFELVASSAEGLGALLLDEPTRGLDRGRRAELAERIKVIAQSGSAIVVATHDAELAATVADRVVLIAEGRVLADGAPSDVLAGGWYFTTETARILNGAGGALLPEEGALLLTQSDAGAQR